MNKPYVHSPRVSNEDLETPSNQEIKDEVEINYGMGLLWDIEEKKILDEMHDSQYDYYDRDRYDYEQEYEQDFDYEDDDFYRNFAREEGF